METPVNRDCALSKISEIALLFLREKKNCNGNAAVVKTLFFTLVVFQVAKKMKNGTPANCVSIGLNKRIEKNKSAIQSGTEMKDWEISGLCLAPTDQKGFPEVSQTPLTGS